VLSGVKRLSRIAWNVYCEDFLSTERKPNAVPPIDLLSGGEIQIGNGNLDGVSVIQNPKHVAYDGVVLDRHAMPIPE